MPDRQLPLRPSLEQYKKQAKDLVRDLSHAAPEALTRIRDHHPRLRDLPDGAIRRASFKLSDAQLIVAREHAFESWPKFAKHVQTLQPVQADPALDDAPLPTPLAERIRVDGMELAAEIALPENPAGLVLFAHANGSGHYHPRNRYVAEMLNRGALGTVQVDLLTEDEELADLETEALRLDIRLLGRRVGAITEWIGQHPALKDLGLGYLASGTGAPGALFAAAERPSQVRAVVSSGGRPDLAGPWIWRVKAPTLLIVGDKDTAALAFNHSAMAWFARETVSKLDVIEGAGQLFEGKVASQKSAALARDWFRRFLAS